MGDGKHRSQGASLVSMCLIIAAQRRYTNILTSNRNNDSHKLFQIRSHVGSTTCSRRGVLVVFSCTPIGAMPLPVNPVYYTRNGSQKFFESFVPGKKVEPNDEEMDDGAADLHGDAYDEQEREADQFGYDNDDGEEYVTSADQYDNDEDATATNIDTAFTRPAQESNPRCQGAKDHYPPFICSQGKDHCPKKFQKRTQLKEWLFLAAVQGCKPCVEHCLEEIVESWIGLDVVDWAQLGVDQAVDGAQEVLDYLYSEWNMDPPIAETVDSSQRVLMGPQRSSPYLRVTNYSKFKKKTRSHRETYKLFPPPLGSTDDAPSEMVPLTPGDIPFEGGRYLCKRHKPKSKCRRDDPKYWFFKAVTDGCQDCVAFCVDRHGIDKNVVSDNNKFTAQDFARYNKDTDMLQFLQMLDI
jgi:hypothetical protein